jgi:hypothetical protein
MQGLSSSIFTHHFKNDTLLGLSLRANLEKPEADLLRIELMPFYDPKNPLGDRSVYLRDDGQLQIF